MNAQVDQFCSAAAEKGLLTKRQGALLRQMCSDYTTTEQLNELIKASGILRGVDGLKLKWLSRQRSKTEEAGGAERDAGTEAGRKKMEERAFFKKQWRPSAELEWFCFYGVMEGIFSADACLCIVSSFDHVADLLPFTQVLIRSGACEDVAVLQKLAARAVKMAKETKRLPFSVLDAWLAKQLETEASG